MCCLGPVQELTEQKNELLGKVQTLKKELHDWRGKLDGQLKTYREVRGFAGSHAHTAGQWLGKAHAQQVWEGASPS